MMMTRVDLVTDQDGHIYTRVKNSNKLFHSGKFLNNQLEYDGEAVSGCSLYMHPFSISPNACVVYDSRRKRMFHVCDSGGSVEWDMQEGDVGAGHSFPILNIFRITFPQGIFLMTIFSAATTLPQPWT